MLVKILRHVLAIAIFIFFLGIFPYLIAQTFDFWGHPQTMLTYQLGLFLACVIYERIFIRVARKKDYLNAVLAILILYLAIRGAIDHGYNLMFGNEYFHQAIGNPIGRFWAIMLVGEIVYYFMHKYYHTSHIFYKSGHFVHHTGTRFFPFLGYINGIVEQPIQFVLDVILLHLLGDPVSASMFIYFWTFWVFFIHFPLPIPSAPYHFLIVTPQFHYIHHEPKHLNSNFSRLITVFDFIFGTVKVPKDDEMEISPDVGLKALEKKYGVNWLVWSRENLQSFWKKS